MQIRRRPARGFTLIETLVVVSIIGILLVVAVPSMRDIIERNTVSGQVNGFVGAVNLARSEAIKRGVTVVMCRSDNAESASPTCTNGTNWVSGWIVFADRDGTSNFTTGGGDVLLRAQGALSGSGGIVQSTAGILSFRSTGLMISGASNFTFDSASSEGRQRRLVCLTLQGRTRTTTDAAGTCA